MSVSCPRASIQHCWRVACILCLVIISSRNNASSWIISIYVLMHWLMCDSNYRLLHMFSHPLRIRLKILELMSPWLRLSEWSTYICLSVAVYHEHIDSVHIIFSLICRFTSVYDVCSQRLFGCSLEVLGIAWSPYRLLGIPIFGKLILLAPSCFLIH